jgi:hypothetical protein
MKTPEVMRRLLLVGAALCGLVSTAPAADKPMQMPIDFIGEWCQANEESYVKGATNYKLPSWTEGGVCTRILSTEVVARPVYMRKQTS